MSKGGASNGVRRRSLVVVLVMLAWMCTGVGSLAQPVGQVAIVVNPEVPVDGLSFTQLRTIFLGDQQFWPDRRRIALLMRAPEAAERETVLERIYGMTEDQFRRYWIAKIFRSEITSGPKIVYSTEMAFELVNALPGSITFMRADDVRSGSKVLRIDGKLPGDQGYPL